MIEENIPFARPYLGKEEEEAVLRVLRSGWLTTGPETLAFEKEFACFLGAETHNPPLLALAVNSATSGLHLALEASGAGSGDVVLLPSYTFAATAEIALYLGAEVAFVDTIPDSFLIDPDKLESTIARLAAGKNAYADGNGPLGRPKAVIPVHFGGLCCDMDAIMHIAQKHNLAVIEDAAHALPSFLQDGRCAGTIGDIGVFSFYATKTLATGEGGMVVTKNETLARRMTTMRLHGIDRPVWNRYHGKNPSWRYEIIEAGYKYNMCDILAAIGRVQLGRVNDLWQMRKALASCYDTAFQADERFMLPPTNQFDARHLYPLRLNHDTTKYSRDAVVEKLNAAGIGTSVHFIPLHTMPFYTKRYSIKNEDFPETMHSFCAELSLPLWPGMTANQIQRVIKAVQDVC